MVAPTLQPSDGQLVTALEQALLATVEQFTEEHRPYVGLHHICAGLLHLGLRLEAAGAAQDPPR